MISQAIKDVLGERKEHVDAVKILNEELQRLKSEQFFICPRDVCGKRTKVKCVPLIRKHFYTHTNAGAGSYWTFCEHQILCPKCSRLIRANTKELEDFISEHNRSFREEVDWYPSRYDEWESGEDLIVMCKKKAA